MWYWWTLLTAACLIVLAAAAGLYWQMRDVRRLKREMLLRIAQDERLVEQGDALVDAWNRFQQGNPGPVEGESRD